MLLKNRIRRRKFRNSLIPELRRFIEKIILGYESESCDLCGKHYHIVWKAPDVVWDLVYEFSSGINKNGGGLLCPQCFSLNASRIGYRTTFDAKMIKIDERYH